MACKTTCKKEEGRFSLPLEPSTDQKNDVQIVLHLPLLTALLKRNEWPLEHLALSILRSLGTIHSSKNLLMKNSMRHKAPEPVERNKKGVGKASDQYGIGTTSEEGFG